MLVNMDHHRKLTRAQCKNWILRPCFKKSFREVTLCSPLGHPLASVEWNPAQHSLCRRGLPAFNESSIRLIQVCPGWSRYMARKCTNYKQIEQQSGLRLHGNCANPRVRKNLALAHMQLYCKYCFLIVAWLVFFPIASRRTSIPCLK